MPSQDRFTDGRFSAFFHHPIVFLLQAGTFSTCSSPYERCIARIDESLRGAASGLTHHFHVLVINLYAL